MVSHGHALLHNHIHLGRDAVPNVNLGSIAATTIPDMPSPVELVKRAKSTETSAETNNNTGTIAIAVSIVYVIHPICTTRVLLTDHTVFPLPSLSFSSSFSTVATSRKSAYRMPVIRTDLMILAWIPLLDRERRQRVEERVRLRWKAMLSWRSLSAMDMACLWTWEQTRTCYHRRCKTRESLCTLYLVPLHTEPTTTPSDLLPT